MDAYVDNLTCVLHDVFKDATCELCGVPISGYASYQYYYSRYINFCICEDPEYVNVPPPGEMDRTTWTWLLDVDLSYQLMYELQVPCTSTMVIIITEFRYCFSESNAEQYIEICTALHQFYLTTKMPIIRFIHCFLGSMATTNGNIDQRMEKAFAAIRRLEAHRYATEDAWEMEMDEFENVIQWMPREIMEMTTDMLVTYNHTSTSLLY